MSLRSSFGSDRMTNRASCGRGWIVLGAIAVLAAFPGEAVSQQRPELPSIPSIINPKLDTVTVARVGPWTISATEFLLSYDLGPAFVKRVKDSRRRYLNFMVCEKLLALGARERGLDAWPDVRRQTEEIEADLATEELYRSDVLGRVHVPDREIARGVEEERIHLAVRWLFAATPEELQKHLNALRSGVPFDSLFATQFRKGVTVNDRSMESTKFRLRTQNSAFATVVDTLLPGRVSIPVHGPDGWYLVQVTDMSTSPVMTQMEEAKVRENVRQALTQHAADSLSDSHVRRMMEGMSPTIVREPFNAVQAYLGKHFLDTNTFYGWKLADRPGARGLPDCSTLDAIASQTLVQLKGGKMTVRQFLDWYRMREPYVKLSLTSPRAFFASVEQLVWRMVRDRLLTERAYARGFQKQPSVRKQSRWWHEKMLYIARKQEIGDGIRDSLPSLRKYYDEHQRTFADEHGTVKPFDEVRDTVWREYYSDELRKRLLHEVLRLKAKYGVEVRQKTVEGLPVDAENDPRAIDVYPVKNGGIYPRQAFPSIDYDWQGWD